jgi:hypothetical protein
MANFPSRPAHLASACTVFLGRLAASGALVAPDAVLHRIAVRFPESFLALARDYPSASAGTAWPGAHQALRLRVVQQKVAFQPEPLAVEHQVQPVSAPKALLDVLFQEQLCAARPWTADESVWLLAVSSQAQRAPRAWQQAAAQQPGYSQVAGPLAWVQLAQQQVQPKLALGPQEQPVALLAQREQQLVLDLAQLPPAPLVLQPR